MFYPFLEHKNYFLMAFSICKVTLECHEDVVFVLFSAISVCHSLMTTQHLCWLQLFSCKSNMFSLLTYMVRTFLFWPQWSFLFDLNSLFFLTSMVFFLCDWHSWIIIHFFIDLHDQYLHFQSQKRHSITFFVISIFSDGVCVFSSRHSVVVNSQVSMQTQALTLVHGPATLVLGT